MELDVLRCCSQVCDREFLSGITYAYGTSTVKMQLHFIELATFLVRNSISRA